MPGLFGLVSTETASFSSVTDSMIGILRYGRAIYTEQYCDKQIHIGCIHLHNGGQSMLYDSPQACVAFFGYLTKPCFPPGAAMDATISAAGYIHDGYILNGEKIFEGLEGAYSIAIWDKQDNSLYLVVDRMGLRPIYFAEFNRSFRFSSEVKAFLSDPSFPRRLDRSAAADFFHFRHIMGERTFFEDIRLLPPASFLRWQEGALRVTRYWVPSFPNTFPHHPDSWYDEQIAAGLKTAVSRTILPNLQYGISLSSGIDSRWLAALLGDCQPGSHSFTFQGINTTRAEAEVAHQVADLCGLDHHQHILSSSFLSKCAEKIVFISDGMQSLVDAQEFPLFEEMYKYVDVVLGGFMGSGFFGHHPVYYVIPEWDVFSFTKRRMQSSLPPRMLLERIFGIQTYTELENLALEDLRNSMAGAPSHLGFQILSYMDIYQRQRRFTYTAQLMKNPYVEMVHPIADNQIWELSTILPPSQLVYKRALRRSLGRFYPELAQLPWNKIPGPATVPVSYIFARETCKRISKKISPWFGFHGNNNFSSPMGYSNWMKGPLREFIETILISDEVASTGLFDMEGLKSVMKGYFSGSYDISTFLGLSLTFALWLKMFFLPSAPQKCQLLIPDTN